ncbi:ATP-binding protein [Paenibacillus sp. N3.4]|uniref:ATP-binding protein n=1 Tax=Paenibacillus sp. N3.4 TaxID=2603222 RepID=UPI0011CC330F|nr:ATP-binding protein [Paenibacillus sp. N3.4]TXK81437.1 response regulator [Paenibacillus sp. N3.4]
MKFRTKLFVGFATILSLLFIFSFIVIRMFFIMNQNMHGIVDDNYTKVRLANNVRSDINSLSMETNELLLDANMDLLNERSNRIRQTKISLNTNLNKLEQMFESQSDENKLAQQIQQLHGLFIESNDAAVELLRNNKKEQAISWHNSNTEPIKVTLFESIMKFNKLQEYDMDQSLAKSTDTYYFTIRLIIGLVIITLLCGIFVAIWVFRSVTKSLAHIISVMKQAALSERSDQLPRIEVETKDEMASIGHVYNVMAIALEEHAKYQKQANFILQEQNWNKTKVAEITAMYQGVQNLTGLAKIFITAICPAIGASYGVFYNRKEMEQGLPRLIRAGAYAADNKEIGFDSFAFGEGLVGQCAAENKVIVLTEPPKDYIQISSGLGTASPVQIAIVPVQFEGNVIAVIELASFREFTPSQLQLLEELTDILGITVNSVAGQMQIQQLLNESQMFTVELQTQSEELQLQQEELKTLNEQLEEQIEASEKKSMELGKIKTVLEEKNKHILLASGYKSEFLANMSHELRTPLNSLLILSQMLAENKEGNLSPKQVEFSQTIHSSGKDLLGLINDVLNLSKIESGKLELDFDWVHLKKVANVVERQFDPIASNKGLQFHVRVADEIFDTMIYTDEQRLQQILQNLLSNAFKFTEQGSVSLEIQMIAKEEVQGAPNDSLSELTLAISVSDTGIGIAKEKQAVIFEAFRQADGTTSRKYGGTGLGLSICQKIAQLLNGFIRIESEEGIGSTFTVYIPISGVRSELPALTNQEAAATIDSNSSDAIKESDGPMDISLKGKKILLVDDDLRNIYALTTALEAHHIHIIFAENGKEGINLLYENTDTDLVIMDIMMPKMDGYEAIKEIRRNAQFKSLPIIALTAKAMKYDREKCIEAGASDYISKPILLDQLMSLLRVWLYR